MTPATGNPEEAGAAPLVETVLGDVSEACWSGREHDLVDVGWGDAAKHRRMLRTISGREVALRLPRGSFLSDGDVLLDDGITIVVVRRPAEPAIVVDTASYSESEAIRAALLLGYALGNQHAPLELTPDDVRAPLLTGPDTARRTLAELGLRGSVHETPLAAHGWTTTSGEHRDAHRHD
ncbi:MULTISPECIES: hypothetical protein [Pseudonocardia]|uniref:Urease accessory protein UreE n=2 Tax=Pseudonocardia TaxID=1847 RepID=A0A1Y2N0U2_PSEAH|nr:MULTISPECIES: hypothetical protein [Pseudonocardia]OSY40727.1 Urease accessory protein UreE [Pseudonocardia autotrophica]TDN71966.1 urease accessory protein [Pseudonocardia autotrophica]BBG02653.1 hypothetical protein Pdca_38620 [Pseudonocardia autotrophica]GEC24712.1 hypothetical protein PSA01_17410 [Pseudonocardia saturnea]